MLFRNASLPDFRVFLEVATGVSFGMMDIVGPTDVRTRNLIFTPQTRLDLIEHVGHRGRRIADQGTNQPPKTASIFWTSFGSRPIKFRQTWGPTCGRLFFGMVGRLCKGRRHLCGAGVCFITKIHLPATFRSVDVYVGVTFSFVPKLLGFYPW